jgi:hypothetical protein
LYHKRDSVLGLCSIRIMLSQIMLNHASIARGQLAVSTPYPVDWSLTAREQTEVCPHRVRHEPDRFAPSWYIGLRKPIAGFEEKIGEALEVTG